MKKGFLLSLLFGVSCAAFAAGTERLMVSTAEFDRLGWSWSIPNACPRLR